MTDSSPTPLPRPIPQRRFWIALILQLVLIVAIPSQAIYTHLSGKTVILQTVPVDPYDWLRGYSQTLRYDISRLDLLQNLPKKDNSAKFDWKPGTNLYVILETPPGNLSVQETPSPWIPVVVSRDRPLNLPSNQIALQGTVSGLSWVDYGIESYYFPENQRQAIQEAINSAVGNDLQAYVVEVKVDPRGHAILISLWVGDRNYRF